MSSTSVYQTKLQTEFPQLDSALLAALLAEIELDSKGDARITPPSICELNGLREILQTLAAGAEADELAHDLLDTTTDDGTYATTMATSVGSDSDASVQSFSSPLGFLQAALPDIDVAKLRAALNAAPVDVDEVDMEAIIESLLTSQFIRELEERGLDALEDDVEGGGDMASSWETMGKKNKKTITIKVHKRVKPTQRTTLIIGDIRQKQYSSPLSPSSSGPYTDPWTQVTSLSTHLAKLLHPHEASFFQSYFHSPQYATPVDAVRAALAAITLAAKPSSTTSVLFGLLDIIRASPEYAYDTLDVLDRDRVIEDVQLAVNASVATHAPAPIARPGEFGQQFAEESGGASEALDIVRLLHELEEDGSMGIYHDTPLSSPLTPIRYAEIAAQGNKVSVPISPAQPPPVPPPPPSKHNTTAKRKTASSTPSKASPYQWQAVPTRAVPARGLHTHTQHIPAYSTNVNGVRVRSKGAKVPTTSTAQRGGLYSVHGGAGSTSYENNTADIRYRRRMAETLKKRDALLREASRAWARGGSKTRGGEVAAYFADRARQCQELARREALEAAREMVETKRSSSRTPDTVDLHGTTSAEAVIIVRETLQQQNTSATKPLTIITGRGNHSAGQIGVLKPAIRAALLQDGWNVGTWDGGLTVRGRSRT